MQVSHGNLLKIQTERNEPFIILQVSDQGGGVSFAKNDGQVDINEFQLGKTTKEEETNEEEQSEQQEQTESETITESTNEQEKEKTLEDTINFVSELIINILKGAKATFQELLKRLQSR